MVKGKKPVKKKTGKPIKLPDGTSANADFDDVSFREAFEKWERTAEGLVGDSIGVISPENSGKSLLDFVKSQGILGRTKGKKGPQSKKGGVEIFKALKTIFNKPDLSKGQTIALKSLDTLMDGIKNTSADPRNIRFNSPIDWDDDSGVVFESAPVYGHYRTKSYARTRRLKDEDVPAVSSSWFNGAENTATPPFWQVLYGEGNAAPFNSPSLHQIVKKAIEQLEEVTIVIDKNNRVPIEGASAATTALSISLLRGIIDKHLDEGKSGTGSFPDNKVHGLIINNPFNLRTEKESEAVKTLKKLNIPHEIEECWFKLSRRQVKIMAVKRAKQKGIKMHWSKTSGDVAANPLKFGERPDPDAEKKSLNNWKDMVRL